MKLEEFLTQLGMRPTTKKENFYKNGVYHQLVVPNDEIIVQTRRGDERDIIMNNLEKPVIYTRIHGTIVLFAFKIKGNYAFYYMNKVNGMNMTRINLKRFQAVDKLCTEMSTLEVFKEGDILEHLYMAEELGGKK